MELYTLDGLYRRTELIEGYESYLWLEAYSKAGELQIITPSTQQYRNLLASGTLVGHSESQRVMKIKTIQDSEDETGNKTLTVQAYEIVDIFKDRVAATGLIGEEVGTWLGVGKPSDVMRALFDYVCRTGTSGPGDALPLMETGSLHTPGNIPEELTPYYIERKVGRLYEAISELADVWDLGFRLYKGPDTGKLYFDVYKGNDRTTNQTVLPAVIFSPDLDTLQQVSELTSVVGSKNVAQVTNPYMTVMVFSDGASVTTAGFDKRTLFVDATDIKYEERTNVMSDTTQTALNKAIGLKEALEDQKTAMQKLISKIRLDTGENALITAFTADMVTATLLTSGEKTLIDAAVTASLALNAAETAAMTAAMVQRGAEELAKNRSISAFDGVITQFSPYKYNTHYDMGDLVEMRNVDGLTNQMLVSEQIFAADENGERAYPTLTMKLFITPGSWLAWENSQVWQDAPGTWSEA